MISKWILIKNSVGLHARPVSQLAAAASAYQSETLLTCHNRTVDLKNSIRTLALGINSGEIVELTVSGKDESDAFGEIISLFDEINRQ